MSNWKFTDASNRVVSRVSKGFVESCSVESVADWLAAGNTPTPADVLPIKTVLELDIEKYKRRADAKPLLMAKMAAMNVGRLKTGTWTTAQLVSLMADPEIKALVSHMETLSFEIGIGVVNGLTNPLITPAIKAVWVAELTAAL